MAARRWPLPTRLAASDDACAQRPGPGLTARAAMLAACAPTFQQQAGGAAPRRCQVRALSRPPHRRPPGTAAAFVFRSPAAGHDTARPTMDRDELPDRRGRARCTGQPTPFDEARARRDHPAGPAAAWRGAQLRHGVPRPVQPLAPGLRRPADPDRRPRPPDQRDRPEQARRGAAAGRSPRRCTGRIGASPSRAAAAPSRAQSARRSVDGRSIPDSDEIFTEEQRSRRPTVFSALREIIAAFAGPDPHLGLYGAFGYDLAFQFEPVRQQHRRDGPAPSATWCCTCPT